jgi:hypothetical protein
MSGQSETSGPTCTCILGHRDHIEGATTTVMGCAIHWDSEVGRAEREELRKRGGLDFEHIPIERHWGLSMRLHEALGHSEPWEICEAGCDALASEAIRIIFGEVPVRGQSE